jgi:uronate dehydrogenase
VLVTGAAGRIGTVLREAWHGRFPLLRLVDVCDLGVAAPGEDLVQLDITDFAGVWGALEEIDVVVHLAGITTEDLFSRLLEANVRGTFNIFEAARQRGVRRVVFASSNHVTGFYPRTQRIGPNHPVRPDSMYGATKAFGEAVGRLYADKWKLEVVCLRIGSFAERPTSTHAMGMWLSPRDAVQLFTKAVTVAGVGYLIVFGLSRNRRSWWDNPGQHVLGYEPIDDAEAAAGDELKRQSAVASTLLQGGRYTAQDFWVAPEEDDAGEGS